MSRAGGNAFFGVDSGRKATGNWNTLLGSGSGRSQTSASGSTFVGDGTGYSTTTGPYNVFVGTAAGYTNTTGAYNTFVGTWAGYDSNTTDANTYLGAWAGFGNKGHGNVFIGYGAGVSAAGSNRLIIDNALTSTPFISGGFDNRLLQIDGEVEASENFTASWSGVNDSGDGMKRVFQGIANNTTGTAGKTSDAGFALKNAKTNKEWVFRTYNGGNDFSISRVGTGGAEFYVSNLTNDYHKVTMALSNGWYVDSNGQAHNASSRSYKENIHKLSTQEAMEAFKQLQTVKYNFKRDADKEQMVGFIAEDVPELIATKDRKTVDPLKIVGMLNAVVHAQQKMLKSQAEKLAAKDAEMKTMQAEIESLKGMQERLTRLETILTNVAHSETLESKDAVSLNEK